MEKAAQSQRTSRLFGRRATRSLVLAGALLAPLSADAHDDAVTRALRLQFAEGFSLEGAGRWADALARFEGIARVRPTAHVQFHIALCHERLGRLLLAERMYKDARDLAGSTAPDVAREVEARLRDLLSRLPRLVLVVAGAAEGTTVKLDGRTVAASEMLRIDPGPHVAVAMRGQVPVAAVAFSILEQRTRFITLTVYPVQRLSTR